MINSARHMTTTTIAIMFGHCFTLYSLHHYLTACHHMTVTTCSRTAGPLQLITQYQMDLRMRKFVISKLWGRVWQRRSQQYELA